MKENVSGYSRNPCSLNRERDSVPSLTSALPPCSRPLEFIQPLATRAEAWQAIPGVSEWVMGIIKRGYSLQFARRPPRFSGVVSTSVQGENARVLRSEVMTLLEKGAIEMVSPALSESGFYSPTLWAVSGPPYFYEVHGRGSFPSETDGNSHSQLPHSGPVRGGTTFTQNPHPQPLRAPGAQGQFRQKRTVSQPTNIVPGYSSGLSSHERGDSARTRSGHSETRGHLQERHRSPTQSVSENAGPYGRSISQCYSWAIRSARADSATDSSPLARAPETGSPLSGERNNMAPCQSVGRDNSVVRFLKGARRLNPPRPLTVPTWDLPTVLRALKGPPFEPLQSTDLRSLLLKTALLLALASVKRVGDLQALSISPACLEFGPNDSKVVLKPRHGYVPKVLSTPFRAQVITLSALPPSEEDRELSLLCPVRALRIYFERSAPFRHTEQLFVSFGNRTKGHPVTKQRLSK